MKSWLVHGIGILIPFCSTIAQDSDRNVIVATRIDTPPMIDGNVTESVWFLAPAHDNFYQQEPDDGAPATERTELRILYDDNALYISFVCFDSEPDKIVRRLTRRDRSVPSDYVAVAIDSYNDRSTAFVFEINAAGVQRDLLMLNDGADEDVTWDGIWYSAVAMRDDGWSAELKIPFETLRFSAADEQVWGFNAARKIDRKNEFVLWQHIPRTSRAVVSRFGILRGLENLNPPRSIRILPYTVAGTTRWPSDHIPQRLNQLEPNLDAGIDIQYAVSNNTMLSVTVNPDFGQVELDEVILNLSAFESFYPERRPFFVEGASMFRTVGPLGDGLLRTHIFYSRRIGAQPTLFHYIPDSLKIEDWTLEKNPAATPILGAAKLTTKSGGGWEAGLLNATTARTLKLLRGPEGEELMIQTEPLSNYSVGRARYNLTSPGSYVGGIATAIFRERGILRAFSGGVDWNFNTENYKFGTDGLLAITHRVTPRGIQEGYHVQARIQTLSHTNINAMLGGNIYTRDFNPNDIGFNSASNMGIYYGWFQLRHLEPFGIIRRINYSQFNYFATILDPGNFLVRGIEPNLSITWMNYWYTSAGGSVESAANDPFESRGAGIYRRPPSMRLWLYSRTDNRKPLTIGVQYAGTDRGSAGMEHDYSIPVTIRSEYRTEVSVNLSYRVTRNTIGWVWNINGLLQPDLTTSVFGRYDADRINATIRATHTFSPRLTLQGYVQYFWARGRYFRFYSLLENGDLTELPVQYDKTHYHNPDFNRSTFNINLILRYEYRPMSTIFVVWTHSREEGIHDATIPAGRFLHRTIQSPSLNVILLKWTYAFGF